MNDTPEAVAAEEREFERIAEILYGGNEEQLESLAGWRCPRCGKPFSYEYSQRYGGFSYGCGRLRARSCKVFEPPACVELYGDRHTF